MKGSEVITTLICTYKRSELLKKTIESVINQTYKNIKIHVIDDKSEDETENIVNVLRLKDSRIVYECNEKNLGARKNFKYAFSSVETEYFSMLSDDDLLLNDFYENAIEILDKNEGIDFVIFESIKINEKKEFIAANKINNELKIYENHEGLRLFYENKIPHDWTAVVFRKKVADIYLKMNADNDAGVDIRFMAYAIAKCKFAVYSKYASLFTIHKQSETYSRQLMDYYHIGIMLGRYIELLEDNEISEEAKVIINKQLLINLNRNHKKESQFFLIKKYLKSLYNIENITKYEIEKNIDEAKYINQIGKKLFTIINKEINRKIIKISLKIIFYNKINEIKNRKIIMNKVIRELNYG